MTVKPIVLIVEDEADSRETLRELLELEGYRVETAVNGKEALDRISAIGDENCVVLLDLFMPVLDGWQVIEQLRTEGRLSKTKVLITTSARHKAPSGIPVLEKPLDFDKMLRAVESFA